MDEEEEDEPEDAEGLEEEEEDEGDNDYEMDYFDNGEEDDFENLGGGGGGDDGERTSLFFSFCSSRFCESRILTRRVRQSQMAVLWTEAALDCCNNYLHDISRHDCQSRAAKRSDLRRANTRSCQRDGDS